nr:hypothetical protein [uncultured Flavobacterium sp.]
MTKEKQKTCFIIMPISDNSSYSAGHFGRVYEYIIKPACEAAGFIAIRADDIKTTNYIAIDIIKKIIESDMAICDLSSQNANVLYELGIRQAFNKPVTLIKDNLTKRIFDIQGFRDLEYDSTLRIDSVNTAITQLTEVITETYQNGETEINSLVKILGIAPAEIAEKTKLSFESEIILNQLSLISKRLDTFENKKNVVENNNSDFRIVDNFQIPPPPPPVNTYKLPLEEIENLSPGESIYHEKLGYGKIFSISGQGADKKLNIKFANGGIKPLLARLSPLYKVN